MEDQRKGTKEAKVKKYSMGMVLVTIGISDYNKACAHSYES